MELGSSSSISSAAARPLQDVASLLVDAQQSISQLHQSRQPFNVIANHIKVRRQTNIRLPDAKDPFFDEKKKPAGHVNAELIPKLQQPQIHDPHRFGTKHPIKPGHAYVSAEIVGEDGKPYAPRKQWKGISDEPETFRSPFAKFIHPPKVGSSADVVNVDPNTKLTEVEQKAVAALQLRLKSLLDRLGANIVWDHTLVANRRLISEFDAIKTESRTLMEEYELRTGVKTIAWQLQENDVNGLTVPLGRATDIHFANQPELASRPLQRKGSHKTPTMTKQQLKSLAVQHGVTPPQPQEQLVNVAWKKQADGVVKAKVNLEVVDSKVNKKGKPNVSSRVPLPGKVYKSGKVGSPSRAVQIDVVAPAHEQLNRYKNMAAPPSKEEMAKARRAEKKEDIKRAQLKKAAAKKAEKKSIQKAAKKAVKKALKKAAKRSAKKAAAAKAPKKALLEIQVDSAPRINL